MLAMNAARIDSKELRYRPGARGVGVRRMNVRKFHQPTRGARAPFVRSEPTRAEMPTRYHAAFEGWCLNCNEVVGIVRPAEVTAIPVPRLLAVFRALEAGTLHYIATAGGSANVCVNSILNGNHSDRKGGLR
jgi:hypothetical protein